MPNGVKEEYENPEPTADTISDVIWIFRPDTTGEVTSYDLISGTGSEYLLGRKENEIDKIIKIYSNNRRYETYSPYRYYNENTFDFSDEPSEETIIYKLCNDINDSNLSLFSFNTLLDKEIEDQSNRKRIKLVSNDIGQALNSYVSNISSFSFERGKKIKVS